jgi:hypothetical protein
VSPAYATRLYCLPWTSNGLALLRRLRHW